MSSHFSILPRYLRNTALVQRGIRSLSFVDRGKNLFMLGKPKCFELREDTITIEHDLEGAPVALDQVGDNPVLIFDRRLQTCSVR